MVEGTVAAGWSAPVRAIVERAAVPRERLFFADCGDYATIADWLAWEAEWRGWNQADIRRVTGLDAPVVEQVLRGQVKMPRLGVVRMATAIGADPAFPLSLPGVVPERARPRGPSRGESATDFGAAIDRAAARCGLSLHDVAIMLGVTRDTIMRWRSGAVTPAPERIERFRKVFGDA